MKKLLSKIKGNIGNWFLKPLANWYLSKDRSFVYNGLRILVKRGVFHSGLFFSSKYLCSFISSIYLKGKSFLEFGAGSGLISLVAAQKGAIVTASDVNSEAVKNLKLNSAANLLNVKVVYSDLYDNFPNLPEFDFTIINPPYYPKNPTNDFEKAWFCGEGFEYFSKLFLQLNSRIIQGQYFMILSEDCEIDRIKSLALKSGLYMKLVHQKRIFFEANYIFQIKIKSKTF